MKLKYMVAHATQVAQKVLGGASKALVHTATLPYYRFFYFNTLGPIKRLADCCSASDRDPVILHILGRWRDGKIAELHFISIACTVVAAAVIGSFSWNSIQSAFWLASACWYGSLVLSILGILLSAQLIAVLNLIGHVPQDVDDPQTWTVVDRYIPLLLTGQAPSDPPSPSSSGPRWHMVFTWQCPVMFMAFSVCGFLMGLTILVITPLIRLQQEGWTDQTTVSVIYLVLTAVFGGMYVLSSFWIYHYVEVEDEAGVSQHGPSVS